MITGYNHNAKYRGQLFHIQTEDGGEKNPFITTYIFFKGNVITSKKTEYSYLVKDPGLPNAVRLLMQEQHKAMIRSLLHGEFDNLDSLKAVVPEKDEEKADQSPVKSSVYQIYNPSEGEEKLDIEEENKSLDEIILDYLSDKKEE